MGIQILRLFNIFMQNIEKTSYTIQEIWDFLKNKIQEEELNSISYKKESSTILNKLDQ